MTIDSRIVLPVHQAAPALSGSCPAPDLVGYERFAAQARASCWNLRLSVSVWETSVGPWGKVLDQRPLAGERIRRGSRIEVIVAGRPHDHVPDVLGLPLRSVVDELCWLGFVPLVAARRSSQTFAAGHIVSSRPSAGTAMAHGSVVSLTVARARHDATRPYGQAADAE